MKRKIKERIWEGEMRTGEEETGEKEGLSQLNESWAGLLMDLQNRGEMLLL